MPLAMVAWMSLGLMADGSSTEPAAREPVWVEARCATASLAWHGARAITALRKANPSGSWSRADASRNGMASADSSSAYGDGGTTRMFVRSSLSAITTSTAPAVVLAIARSVIGCGEELPSSQDQLSQRRRRSRARGASCFALFPVGCSSSRPLLWLIPGPADQDRYAQSRRPMDMMVHG